MMLGAASAFTAPTASSLAWLKTRAGELPIIVPGLPYSLQRKTKAIEDPTGANLSEQTRALSNSEGIVEEKLKMSTSDSHTGQPQPHGRSSLDKEKAYTAPQELQRKPGEGQEPLQMPQLQEALKKAAHQQQAKPDVDSQSRESELREDAIAQTMDDKKNAPGQNLNACGEASMADRTDDQLPSQQEHITQHDRQKAGAESFDKQQQTSTTEHKEGTGSLEEQADASKSLQDGEKPEEIDASKTDVPNAAEIGKLTLHTFMLVHN